MAVFLFNENLHLRICHCFILYPRFALDYRNAGYLGSHRYGGIQLFAGSRTAVTMEFLDFAAITHRRLGSPCEQGLVSGNG